MHQLRVQITSQKAGEDNKVLYSGYVHQLRVQVTSLKAGEYIYKYCIAGYMHRLRVQVTSLKAGEDIYELPVGIRHQLLTNNV